VILIYLSCAWLAGIFLGSNYNLPVAFSLAGLVPLPFLFLTRRYRKLIVLASAGFIILVVSAAYAYPSLNTVKEDKIQFYNGRASVETKGIISGDPDIRDKSVQLKIASVEIKVDGGWRNVNGTVLVFAPRYPVYRYGDELLMSGVLETPAQIDDFDYRGYLAHQGIYTIMYYPRIEVLAIDKGYKPLTWIYSLRSRLSQSLARVLPEPQAGLAQGIVLGIRANIPESLKNDFTRSGTAHLLAISGVNLTIMAGILLSALLWALGRRGYWYVWLTMGAIWIYAVMTGMNPPVVRGAIMASIFLLAEFLGRQKSAMVALMMTAAVMAGINPRVLGDASFQLSFLAMAGLVVISPAFRSYGRGLVAARLGDEGFPASAANFTVDAFSATLGALIVVWPVIAYYFDIVSLVGPLATFLALPSLPGIIISASLTALIGLVWLALAQVIGWLAWLFLSYMLAVVKGMATPSLSAIEFHLVNVGFIWGYYAVLGATIWFIGNRGKMPKFMPKISIRSRTSIRVAERLLRYKVWIAGALLVIAVPVAYTAATMPDDNLHVSFRDVGEGDAVLIQKGSQQVLVDGGPSPQAISLALGEEMPFWDKSIDMVILTHPHNDHLAGLIEVLRRYNVGQVYGPELKYDSPVFAEWSNIIAEKKIKHIAASTGQRINMGNGIFIEVVNPPNLLVSGTESDIDNNSLVLRLSDGKVSFLLCADIMSETEWRLISERASLASTVLKVAHHGSDSSTSAGFLAVVNPQVAVVSVGADNGFGHPDAEVLQRLTQQTGVKQIYRTDLNGTIDFITDGESLRVKTSK
jgi:competence protein ComEC